MEDDRDALDGEERWVGWKEGNKIKNETSMIRWATEVFYVPSMIEVVAILFWVETFTGRLVLDKDAIKMRVSCI